VSSTDARTATFLAVPIDLYLQMQMHNDAVGRDLLLAIEEGKAAEYAARLSALLGSGERLVAARESMREQVEDARAAGRTHVDIHADYRPDDVVAATTYLRLVEEADDLVARGVIYAPAPSAEVAVLRRWLTAQLLAQVLEGAPPQPFSPLAAPPDQAR
jgi:hypothetical protein